MQKKQHGCVCAMQIEIYTLRQFVAQGLQHPWGCWPGLQRVQKKIVHWASQTPRGSANRANQCNFFSGDTGKSGLDGPPPIVGPPKKEKFFLRRCALRWKSGF